MSYKILTQQYVEPLLANWWFLPLVGTILLLLGVCFYETIHQRFCPKCGGRLFFYRNAKHRESAPLSVIVWRLFKRERFWCEVCGRVWRVTLLGRYAKRKGM